MKQMRIRPKSDYLHTASWEELYTLTIHWKDDLDFYNDELRFLKDLIGRYFIWITKEESLEKVQELEKRLAVFGKRLEEMNARITKHLEHLGLLMENAFARDERWFRDEHVKLEDDTVRLALEFRILKKDVFGITGHVMESDKLRHLLNPGVAG